MRSVALTLLASAALLGALGRPASADTAWWDAPSSDTQSAAGLTVRIDSETVTEGGRRIRIHRIYNDGRLVRVVRTALETVAGFESGQTGYVIVIVEGPARGTGAR